MSSDSQSYSSDTATQPSTSIDLMEYHHMPTVRHPKKVRLNAPVSIGEINPAFDGDDENDWGQRVPRGNGINNGSGNENSPKKSIEKDFHESGKITFVDQKGRISREHVMSTNRDGVNVVVTSDRQSWRDEGRILREKDLKYYKVFSIISIILFFPSGFPAFYYYHKAYKEFYAGLERGEIDTARKMARRCEKLIICSVICSIVLVVMIIALVEKQVHNHDQEVIRKTPQYLWGRPTP